MVRERKAARPKRAPALIRKLANRKDDGADDAIWKTPRIKKLLKQPVGTPVKLTPEDARAIALASFGKGKGKWPDGATYVKQVRGIWRGLVKKTNG